MYGKMILMSEVRGSHVDELHNDIGFVCFTCAVCVACATIKMSTVSVIVHIYLLLYTDA
jgi:hypothetical protein